MPDTNAVVAIYNTHTEAEEAVRELQRSGFDMTQLSIVGKDYHTEDHVVGYYTTGDRMKAWGKMGALEGAVVVGGASALGAGLASMGIPRDSIVKYETAIKADKFLLLAHGTPEQVGRAKSILERTSTAEAAAVHQG
jgi:hypothetical protein